MIWCTDGPGQVVFFSHLRKEFRVVQTKRTSTSTGPISGIWRIYMHPGVRYPEMSKKMGSFQLDIKAN